MWHKAIHKHLKLFGIEILKKKYVGKGASCERVEVLSRQLFTEDETIKAVALVHLRYPGWGRGEGGRGEGVRVVSIVMQALCVHTHGLHKKLVRGFRKPRTSFLCHLYEQFAAHVSRGLFSLV